MLEHPVLLLLLYSLLTFTSTQSTDECEAERGRLCRTKARFLTWKAARDHCIDLGGDLTIPKPESKDILQDVMPYYENVWIGGRSTRLWNGDNVFFGSWNGCVEERKLKIEFYPNNSLSECLQSCSLFRYAYMKKYHCGCSHRRYSVTHPNGCVDPYNWAHGEVAGIKIHQFSMTSNDWNAYSHGCGTVKLQSRGSDYSLRIDTQSCDIQQYHALCQSAPARHSRSSVKYGKSFLWRSDFESDWKSAKERCEKENGTLAKLVWESPLLNQQLAKFKNTQMWLGLDRIRWRFIDGREVASVWPNFGTFRQTGCLIWSGWHFPGLEEVNCSYHMSIQALCSLSTDTTPETTRTQPVTTLSIDTTSLPSTWTASVSPNPSHTTVLREEPVSNISILALSVPPSIGSSHGPSAVVGIAVGVSLAVVAAVIIALVITWRVRKMSPQSGTPPNCGSQYHNAAYEATAAQIIISDFRNITSRTQPVPAVSQEDICYVNVGNSTGMGQYVNIHVGSENAKRKLFDGTKADGQYDKLNIPRVHGPLSSHDDSPPAYSVVFLDADNGYVNCSDVAVASHYDHPAALGSPAVPHNTDYDQLDSDHGTLFREVDESSLHNHVTREDSV